MLFNFSNISYFSFTLIVENQSSYQTNFLLYKYFIFNANATNKKEETQAKI